MASALSTLTAKTADATPKTPPIQYNDLSGNGSGPFVAAVTLLDANGNVIASGNALPVADATSAAALATLHSDLQTLAGDEGALGSQADSVWAGSGNGSVVAV